MAPVKVPGLCLAATCSCELSDGASEVKAGGKTGNFFSFPFFFYWVGGVADVIVVLRKG